MPTLTYNIHNWTYFKYWCPKNYTRFQPFSKTTRTSQHQIWSNTLTQIISNVLVLCGPSQEMIGWQETMTKDENDRQILASVVDEPAILVAHWVRLLDDSNDAALGQCQVQLLSSSHVLRDDVQFWVWVAEYTSLVGLGLTALANVITLHQQQQDHRSNNKQWNNCHPKLLHSYINTYLSPFFQVNLG